MSKTKQKTSVRASAKAKPAKSAAPRPPAVPASAPNAAAAKAAPPPAKANTAAHGPTSPNGAKTGKAKKTPAPRAAKPARAAKPTPPRAKKTSGLDAAAMVLAASGKPMKVGAVFEAIKARGLWESKGKTPEATLYAAIIREIADKRSVSRFKKHDRGLFVAMKTA